MKTLKKMTLLFISLILLNCSTDGKLGIPSDDYSFQLPDVIAILEQMENQPKTGGPEPVKPDFDFAFITESDYIDGKNGCYTVNVRVYLVVVATGQKSLVANDNVKVGDCNDEQEKSSNGSSDICKKYQLKNGDTFYDNGTNGDPYCIAELIQYKVIYDGYLESINKVLRVKR